MRLFSSSQDSCDFVHQLNASEQCAFVNATPDCSPQGGFLDYIHFYYCESTDYRAAAIVLYVLWVAVLFVALGVAADDFFCPNLAIISKTLRMSHNIAGVTILALGNGAPDLFSAVAAAGQARPELVLGGLFGAGVFVTTAVAGSVCIVKPFHVMERPFLRDVVFYMAAGYWAFYIFYRGEILLRDTLGFLCMYIVYLLTVIIGRVVHQHQRRRRQEAPLEPESESTATSTDDGTESLVPREADAEEVRVLPAAAVEETSEEPSAPESTRMHLLTALFSEDVLEFRTLSLTSKIWFVIKTPVYVVLALTIPVVDTTKWLSGWCLHLHIAQCYFIPLFVAFATHVAFVPVTSSGPQLWIVALIVGQSAALLIHCLASTSKTPRLHETLAFVGFITSVVWIYIIANEIVSILRSFGLVFGLTDAILGLTVLAWGNSVGDLVNDVSISKKGYPRMGFSACFGGPVFNLLLGIGLPFTYALVQNGGVPIKVEFSPMVLVLSIALGVSLATSFVTLPLTKFQATRWHGLALVGLYLLLLTTALVVEFTVVP